MSYLLILHFTIKAAHDVKNYWHRDLLFIMVQLMITLTLKEKDHFLSLVGNQICGDFVEIFQQNRVFFFPDSIKVQCRKGFAVIVRVC